MYIIIYNQSEAAELHVKLMLFVENIIMWSSWGL